MDYLSAVDYSPCGHQPLLFVDAATWSCPTVPIQSVMIGLDREGILPIIDAAHYDVLLTTAQNAPRPWVSIAPERFDLHIARIQEAILAHRFAAAILCQTLRLNEYRSLDEALLIESLAYSTLLSGVEFRAWRNRQTIKSVQTQTTLAEIMLIERTGDEITLTLNAPSIRNAMTAEMRDALYAALANTLDDPTQPRVTLKGAGACFSTGGYLPEFGTAHDVAQAHCIRTVHNNARLIHTLGARMTVHLHGACIGSGIEIAAAATYRIARPNAWFQLPELRMGLIPGAGGTATLSCAIGRHRTCWMVLTGKKINAQQALEWGLVHRIMA